MPFGDVLRSLRKQNDLTQNQLGTVLGISESTVGMYERGQREPSFEMLETIADYFNVDMDYLTGRSNLQRKYSFSPSISGNAEGKPAPSESDELNEILETLRTREDMRMLFKLSKDASPEDVRQAVKIIEALRKND